MKQSLRELTAEDTTKTMMNGFNYFFDAILCVSTGLWLTDVHR